jgi:sugar phosphate isomerase/epimerase
VKRRIGLAALTVLELPPAEQIAVAADAGYDFVGLRLIPATAQETVHPWRESAFVGEIGRRLADRGITALDVEVFRLDPAVDIDAFEPYVAAAAKLGAKQMLVAGADADERRLADNFGRLCDLAGGYGLSANIEPMPWLHVDTVAQAKRVVDASAKSNAGLLVDAIHFYRVKNSLGELSRAKLHYMQLCDAPAAIPADMNEILRQARFDRLMPGEGGLDLRGLLRALPADLPIGLEIPYARPMPALERASRALAATRKLLAQVEV